MMMMVVIAAVLMGIMRVISTWWRFEAFVTAEVLMQMMETGRSVHCMKIQLKY